jgi:hypothetical protein
MKMPEQPQPVIPGDNAVMLTMATFTVPPGGEIYKCQNFKNPFGGMDAEVSLYESHMTAGSHHMFLFLYDNTADGALEDCSGLEFDEAAYGAQTKDNMTGFPDGVASIVPGSAGLRLQAHYLNTTHQPITAQVQVKMHLAKPGTVTAHAGILFYSQSRFSIPPNGQPTDVNGNCILPFDINLLSVTSHMHKHGVGFTAKAGSQPLYTTTEWSDPAPRLFAPAMPLGKGQTVSFGCTFVNDTDQALTFGESAATNEMCIMAGTYYPVPDGAQSSILECP